MINDERSHESWAQPGEEKEGVLIEEIRRKQLTWSNETAENGGPFMSAKRTNIVIQHGMRAIMDGTGSERVLVVMTMPGLETLAFHSFPRVRTCESKFFFGFFRMKIENDALGMAD